MCYFSRLIYSRGVKRTSHSFTSPVGRFTGVLAALGTKWIYPSHRRNVGSGAKACKGIALLCTAFSRERTISSQWVISKQLTWRKK
jgi:hypothetical protein